MNILDILMYIGTAIFAYQGTKISLIYGNNYLLSTFFGILSSVAGGTLRDIYSNKKVFWIFDKYYIVIVLTSCIFALYKNNL